MQFKSTSEELIRQPSKPSRPVTGMQFKSISKELMGRAPNPSRPVTGMKFKSTSRELMGRGSKPYRQVTGMQFKCCVASCTNGYDKSKTLSFFRIHNKDRDVIQWVSQLNQPELLNGKHGNARICAVHFEDRYFKQAATKNRLEKHAVPTLFLNPSDHNYTKKKPKIKYNGIDDVLIPIMEVNENLEPKTVEMACQTPAMWSMKKKRPKRIVKTKIVYRRPERITDDEFFKFCEENFDDAISDFVKIQLQTVRKLPHGFRYSEGFKHFADSMYSMGPKVYKNLSKFFSLPSKSTVLRKRRSGDLPKKTVNHPETEIINNILTGPVPATEPVPSPGLVLPSVPVPASDI